MNDAARPVPPPLPRIFYARPTIEVARDLLGMGLFVRTADALVGGRIVEVEAYHGPEDRASHAKLRRVRGGLLPTDRSALMFGDPGIAYVYLIYGMHNCVNAVAHEGGAVGAVLVRALEPGPGLVGANLRGPARLCSALGIDRRHNGLDLCAADAPIFIADLGTKVPAADVVATPRIGVDYAGEDAALPYRLCDRRSPHLSRKVG